MGFDWKYYEAEIRSGFVVPSLMKYAWGAQLQLLKIIDDICKNHSLEYYAAWGTLLGTIRHDGFIPWDDDLDLYMKRSDYEAFISYADRELPNHAKLCCVYNEELHGNCIATVFNTQVNCYEEEFLEQYAGWPCGVGIDIVVLDYLPSNIAEKAQLSEALDFLVSLIAQYDILSDSEKQHQLALVKQSLGAKIDRKDDRAVKKQLSLLLEKICSSYSHKEAGELANFMQWQRDKNLKFKSDMFASSQQHIFENTYIPVPCGYDEILRRDYGDYMIPICSGSAHNYPYFISEFVEACIKLNIHQYEPESMPVPRGMDYRQCQFQEKINGYMSKAKQLESELLQEFTQEGFEVLKELTAAMESEVTSENNREKKALFVVCQEKFWKDIEAIYNRVSQEPFSRVDVLVLPYYHKSFAGEIVECIDEADRFPEGLHIVTTEQLVLENWHYDRIYTQIPWDSYDLSLCVEEDYYTDKLREHTDYLVYVPFLTPEPFDEKSERAEFTMQFLCRQPAVIQADSVIVPSEEMRSIYIRKLTEFTGEATRSIWEKKIEVLTQA